jgi:hypothetical protein
MILASVAPIYSLRTDDAFGRPVAQHRACTDWHITHTCAWCVTYQKRNETMFCLMAHINMHAVAIRSRVYGLDRFLDEMGVAQHRACTDWHITHTCAWCVTYQKRNETLFCLMAHINMHAVAIRSRLYGLNRFLDEMGVAQHRAHGIVFLPQWKFVTKHRVPAASWIETGGRAPCMCYGNSSSKKSILI